MKLSAKTTMLISLSIAFMMNGCSQKSIALYNYENYSESYYESKKNPGEEPTLELHKAIEKVIANKDNSTSHRVPPGMYANLGYSYLKNNKPQMAIENFTKEKSIYPESSHFMNRMIKKVQISEGK